MRVVFLAHSYPRQAGGVAGSFLLRLARALGEIGVAVHVVAPSAPGLAATDVIDGVPVSRYRYAPRRHETLAYTGTMVDAVRGGWPSRLALGGLLAAAAVATRRAARAWHADVVHAHWWFPGGLSAALPGAAAGRPLVLTMHGSDVRLARGLAPARLAYARVARRAARVTAVSRWLCAQAAEMAPEVACTVAPMPVAAELFAPPPLGTPREGVLFVGRLTKQKGVAALLHAAAAEASASRLTVVGSGPEEPELRRVSAELGLGDRVRWVPAQPQAALADFYRRAAVVAMPSHEEGLGLVAVEAALCETPVVGFASGGLPDVVQDGETGLLVPPGDSTALCAALAALLHDPNRVRAMGWRARVAAAPFTPAAAARRYIDVYEAALAGPGPRRPA